MKRKDLSLTHSMIALRFLYHETERSCRNVTIKYALLEYNSSIYL
jgi:hypothetical protein